MAGTNYFTPAPNNPKVKISLTDEDNLAVLASCDGNPNAIALDVGLYVVGCFMRRTDIDTGSNIYQQTGTLEMPVWALISSGSGSGVQSVTGDNEHIPVDNTSPANPIVGYEDAISVTYAHFMEDTLTPGWYLITDRADHGILIHVQGGNEDGSGNESSHFAIGGFANPDYYGAYAGISDYSGVNVVTGAGTYGGNWSDSATYGIGDIVRYSDGMTVDRVFYVNITGDNTLQNPENNTTDWKRVNNGVWQIDISYNENQVVVWNNKNWALTQDTNMGTEPGTDFTWMELSKTSNPNNLGYIIVWDTIQFDVINDWIDWREDTSGNKIGGSFAYEAQTGNGFNVIERFQWGSGLSVCSNYAIETLLDCTNAQGGVIANTVQPFSQLLVSGTFGPITKNFIETGSSWSMINSTVVLTGNVIENVSVNFDSAPSGVIRDNRFATGSAITGDSSFSGTIRGCIFEQATVSFDSYSGTLNKSVIQMVNDLSFENGTNLDNCKISNIANIAMIDVTYSGKELSKDQSTFDVVLDITGVSIPDISSYPWAGIFKLSSGDNSNAISGLLTSTYPTWPITLIAEGADNSLVNVTVTSTPVTGPADGCFMLENNIDVTLTWYDAAQDFLILQVYKDNNFFRQNGGSIL